MNDNRHKVMNEDRRRLLKTLAGVGAGLGMGGSGLVSIAGEPLTTAPRRGGRVRVASLSSSTADTLDPARGNLSTDYIRHFMCYNGLTRLDENLEAQLELAESIESEDFITWNIRLRPGIEFHNGKTLDAEDVVYSMMRHQDGAVASKVATIAAQIQDARALAPLEVEIVLSSPNADLAKILATSHFLIIPNGTTDLSQGIGTGPFKIKEFRPGVRTIGVRNENYWKPGKPYLDEVELIGIPDETSRVNALLSGDIHLMIAVNPRSIKRIQESGTHSIKETASGLYTNLILRKDMYPGQNDDFVLAMKYLLDRDLIKRALFRGIATIANDHPVPPMHKYYAADLPQREYDPDRAKYHLKKSGMTGGRFPLFCSPAAEGSVEIASLLQLRAIDIGLNLAVNRVPADGYWSNHWTKHPLSFGNTNPRPSLDLLFSMFFKSSAPWNESAWHNEKFDQLLLASRGERDEATRKQMYVDMQELIHKHCGMGIPVFISMIDGFDNRVRGLGRVPIGGLMGYTFAEHVWWQE